MKAEKRTNLLATIKPNHNQIKIKIHRVLSIIMNMQAKSKWSCIKCDVPIPYNPQFTMANTMCSNCAAYYNADRLLGGYRPDKRRK